MQSFAPVRNVADGIDTRALELAASAEAVLQHHLIECRDRYLTLNNKLDTLNTLFFRGICALVTGLFIILSYLAIHGTQPLIH
jgi:hypothetical protein